MYLESIKKFSNIHIIALKKKSLRAKKDSPIWTDQKLIGKKTEIRLNIPSARVQHIESRC